MQRHIGSALPGGARLRILLAGLVTLVACDARDLLVTPAPPGPASVAISYEMDPLFAALSSSTGGSGAAFDKANQAWVRVVHGSKQLADTVVQFVPAAEARLQIALDVPDALTGVTVLLELRHSGNGLFTGSTNVSLQPGETTAADVQLAPIASGVVVPDSVRTIDALGDTVRITGAAVFATADTIPNVALTWTSLDSAVAITSDGLIVAHAPGVARVVGSYQGMSDTASVQVQQSIASVHVMQQVHSILVGETAQLDAYALDRNQMGVADATFGWESAAPAVAAVDSTGLVTGLGEGQAVIIATGGTVADTAWLSVSAPLTGSTTCSSTGGTSHSGQISASTTWTSSAGPHRITSSVTVDGGAVLTVEAGAMVCAAASTGLYFGEGARLIARGMADSLVVFTAEDPATGWYGLQFSSTAQTDTSYITNALVEYAGTAGYPISTYSSSPVAIDSTVIRKSAGPVYLTAPGSRLSRSTVDSSSVALTSPAVQIGDGVLFEESTVRGSSGVGVNAYGHSARLLGGRIEGSAGIGLETFYLGAARPVRVVGGATYGAHLSLETLALLAPTTADQDSLLGNAADTLRMQGGVLTSGEMVMTTKLPWRIEGHLSFQNSVLRVQPGVQVRPGPSIGLSFGEGARLIARGTADSLVVFTAQDTASGWWGLQFSSTVQTDTSYLTNARVEYAGASGYPISTYSSSPLAIDSTVIRKSTGPIYMSAPGSRLSRSMVDSSTVASTAAAVEISVAMALDGLRIRGSTGRGLHINTGDVAVRACEIRDNVSHGVFMSAGAATNLVNDCNLLANGGDGVHNTDTSASVNATNNWWGDVNGPTGTDGDGVSANVTYSPWRTAPAPVP